MGCCDTPGLLPLDQALSKMLDSIEIINKTQTLALEDAAGYVLASDILSPIFVPPFDNSAMDGYAVRQADLESNTSLKQIGKSFAGQPFDGEYEVNSCVRIMTGAQIPAGYDLVIMQEQTQVNGDEVDFSAALPVQLGQNIRPRGDDIVEGALVLEKGHRLTPRDIPMIASLGIAQVKVYTKPKVAFFSTGDELKPLGTKLAAGEIYDSNRYGIAVLIEKFGCEPVDLGVIPDCKDKLRQAFIDAKNQADVVVTSGGVSVGEADYTKEILDELGEIGFWKLAIKPGKPFAFGKLGDALFCGLPGNPVSAMMTLYVLVQPLLAKLSGHTQWQAPVMIPAQTTTKLKKVPGRTDFQRGIYQLNEDGQFVVETTGNQSSGAFRSMSLANCFIVLERERGHVKAGERVMIQPFNHTLY
ncbi:MAG: molybdopterin molybdotransferase MoeA [Vibrio sp.]